jgi:hypothetical protein
MPQATSRIQKSRLVQEPERRANEAKLRKIFLDLLVEENADDQQAQADEPKYPHES